MLKVIVAAAFGVVVALPAMAGSKEERARELISLLEINAQFDQIQDQIHLTFSGLFEPKGVSEAERAIRDRFHERMLALTLEELGPQKVEAQMIELYLAYFSEQELVDMIEFHRTPTGQRMIETMPMIMEESIMFSQEGMMRLAPRIQALSDEMEAELAVYHSEKAQHQDIAH
ncbi:MAG: DUF2059 domain-containing protein [Wenzhouxiangella sp.]|jgi:hypothetical protein|nr:DUF2059 domain-containing protein [Wenzhouxiangella sp.]